MRGQSAEQTVFKAQLEIVVVGGVLSFRVEANRAASGSALRFGQLDDFFKRRHAEFAVVALIALCCGLLCAQGFDLSECEIRGEPAFFIRAIDFALVLAIGKLWARGHIGGVGDIGLMAGNQDAIFRSH